MSVHISVLDIPISINISYIQNTSFWIYNERRDLGKHDIFVF